MASKAIAAQELRRVVNFFQGLSEAADLLDSIQSLESSADAARLATDVAVRDSVAAKAELTKAKKSLDDVRIKAGAIVEDAQAQASEIINKANRDAEEALAAATIRAGQIVANAAAGSETKLNELRLQIAERTEERDGMATDAEALRQKIELLNAEAEDAEKRLAKVQAQIAKLLG